MCHSNENLISLILLSWKCGYLFNRVTIYVATILHRPFSCIFSHSYFVPFHLVVNFRQILFRAVYWVHEMFQNIAWKRFDMEWKVESENPLLESRGAGVATHCFIFVGHVRGTVGERDCGKLSRNPQEGTSGIDTIYYLNFIAYGTHEESQQNWWLYP